MCTLCDISDTCDVCSVSRVDMYIAGDRRLIENVRVIIWHVCCLTHKWHSYTNRQTYAHTDKLTDCQGRQTDRQLYLTMQGHAWVLVSILHNLSTKLKKMQSCRPCTLLTWTILTGDSWLPVSCFMPSTVSGIGCFWLKMHYKIGLPKTPHSIIWNLIKAQRHAAGRKTYLHQNKFTSKVA